MCALALRCLVYWLCLHLGVGGREVAGMLLLGCALCVGPVGADCDGWVLWLRRGEIAGCHEHRFYLLVVTPC